MHSSLRCLSYMRPNSIPGENIYHFRMRSQEILNKWAPFLRKKLDVLQWVMEGTNSLVYIPLNDGERQVPPPFFCLVTNATLSYSLALRESTEALDMVYGLPENGQFEESATSPTPY